MTQYKVQVEDKDNRGTFESITVDEVDVGAAYESAERQAMECGIENPQAYQAYEIGKHQTHWRYGGANGVSRP